MESPVVLPDRAPPPDGAVPKPILASVRRLAWAKSRDSTWQETQKSNGDAERTSDEAGLSPVTNWLDQCRTPLTASLDDQSANAATAKAGAPRNGCSFEDDLSLGAEADHLQSGNKKTSSCGGLAADQKRSQYKEKGRSMNSTGSGKSSNVSRCVSVGSARLGASVRRPASSRASLDSVSELLDLYEEDPEEILLNLGFGRDEPDMSSRIPARFFNGSSAARGIDIKVYLGAQLQRMEVENPNYALTSRFRQIEVLTTVANQFIQLYGHVSGQPVQSVNGSKDQGGEGEVIKDQSAPPSLFQRKNSAQNVADRLRKRLSKNNLLSAASQAAASAAESAPPAPLDGRDAVDNQHAEKNVRKKDGRSLETVTEEGEQRPSVPPVQNGHRSAPEVVPPPLAPPLLAQLRTVTAADSFDMEEIQSNEDDALLSRTSRSSDLLRTASQQSDSSGFAEETSSADAANLKVQVSSDSCDSETTVTSHPSQDAATPVALDRPSFNLPDARADVSDTVSGADESEPASGAEESPPVGGDEKSELSSCEVENSEPVCGSEDSEPTSGARGSEPASGADKSERARKVESSEPTDSEVASRVPKESPQEPDGSVKESNLISVAQESKPASGTEESEPATGVEQSEPTRSAESTEQTREAEDSEAASRVPTESQQESARGDKVSAPISEAEESGQASSLDWETGEEGHISQLVPQYKAHQLPKNIAPEERGPSGDGAQPREFPEETPHDTCDDPPPSVPSPFRLPAMDSPVLSALNRVKQRLGDAVPHPSRRRHRSGLPLQRSSSLPSSLLFPSKVVSTVKIQLGGGRAYFGQPRYSFRYVQEPDADPDTVNPCSFVSAHVVEKSSDSRERDGSPHPTVRSSGSLRCASPPADWPWITQSVPDLSFDQQRFGHYQRGGTPDPGPDIFHYPCPSPRPETPMSAPHVNPPPLYPAHLHPYASLPNLVHPYVSFHQPPATTPPHYASLWSLPSGTHGPRYHAGNYHTAYHSVPHSPSYPGYPVYDPGPFPPLAPDHVAHRGGAPPAPGFLSGLGQSPGPRRGLGHGPHVSSNLGQSPHPGVGQGYGPYASVGGHVHGPYLGFGPGHSPYSGPGCCPGSHSGFGQSSGQLLSDTEMQLRRVLHDIRGTVQSLNQQLSDVSSASPEASSQQAFAELRQKRHSLSVFRAQMSHLETSVGRQQALVYKHLSPADRLEVEQLESLRSAVKEELLELEQQLEEKLLDIMTPRKVASMDNVSANSALRAMEPVSELLREQLLLRSELSYDERPGSPATPTRPAVYRASVNITPAPPPRGDGRRDRPEEEEKAESAGDEEEALAADHLQQLITEIRENVTQEVRQEILKELMVTTGPSRP
ncbi:protein ITPRID2 isoform X2 [Corythoichthys intestinalis]|uniref:protein ITPRID2 isoform X2 n=1 Tax=Corythoichthys intestinalis TaxID=161448 RepID=UPI0025A662F9|nr:protein ITPRID2 isoform X2 [Corythoichthys intestinalis]